MKKLLLLLVLAFTGSVNADVVLSPKDKTDLVAPGRFVMTVLDKRSGVIIITDTRFGCQYITNNDNTSAGGTSGSMAALGCHPDFSKPQQVK